jgi:hypothetical protein
MNLNDLAAIATVVSGTAVVVSLVYLALQVRQNTRHTRALIHQGRIARSVALHLNLTEPHLAEAWIAGAGATATPQGVARRQFWLLAFSYELSWEDTFVQHELGLLGEEQFADFRARLVDMCAHEGLRTFFSNRPVPPSGTTMFQKFMAGVIADSAARDAGLEVPGLAVKSEEEFGSRS